MAPSGLREPSQSDPISVGFLLIPRFPLMAYSAAVEPLRAANVLAGRELYRWWHATADGQAVEASQGFSIKPDVALEQAAPTASRIFVCAGGNPSIVRDRHLLGLLRRLSRHPGLALGGISGGPFILARAGLLDGHRCTLHWEHVPAFQETFPDVEVARSLYEIDKSRITCSGGIAALDMTLALIARDYGTALAREVSDWFVHNQMREGPLPQRMPFALRFNVHDERLSRVLSAMESNVEDPVPRQALAALACVSLRQLERLFSDATHMSLHEYYLRLRLAHARHLGRETTLSRNEIAQASGFKSVAELRRVQRRYQGQDT